MALDESSLAPVSFSGDVGFTRRPGGTIGAIGAIGEIAANGLIGDIDVRPTSGAIEDSEVLDSIGAIGEMGLYWGAAAVTAMIAETVIN